MIPCNLTRASIKVTIGVPLFRAEVEGELRVLLRVRRCGTEVRRCGGWIVTDSGNPKRLKLELTTVHEGYLYYKKVDY
jgi:hypothetical protein